MNSISKLLIAFKKIIINYYLKFYKRDGYVYVYTLNIHSIGVSQMLCNWKLSKQGNDQFKML